MNLDKEITLSKLQQLHRSMDFLSVVNSRGEMVEKSLLMGVVDKETSKILKGKTAQLKRLMSINQERAQLIDSIMKLESSEQPDFVKLISAWLESNTIDQENYTLLEIKPDDSVLLLDADDLEPDEYMMDSPFDDFLKEINEKYERDFSLPYGYFGK